MARRVSGSLSFCSRLAAGFGLLAILHAAPVSAQEDGSDPAGPLRWSGFGTLGLVHHDNDDVGVIHSFSQRRPAKHGWSANLDTVLGLQLDARLAAATSVTVQGVTRAGDDFKPKLRMGYLRQGIGPDFAVRLGRIRSPLFFDSDVGEIGFATLTVRPGLPLYATAVNSAPHVDGGDVQWRHQLGPAAVMLQGFLGRSSYDQMFYNTTPRSEAEGELKSIRGLAVSVSLPQLTVRASHTRAGFSMRSAQLGQINAGLGQLAGGIGQAAANPALPAPLQAALAAQAAAIQAHTDPFDGDVRYTSLGFDASLQNWRLMGEWALLDSRAEIIGRYRGWSATVGYTLGAFTPYVTASRNDRRTAALDTGALAATQLSPALDAGLAQLRGALDEAARFADLSSRSIGIGARWDVRANMAVKLQFERLRTPSGNVPGVFAVQSLPIDSAVNLFSASLSFVF
ncbi:MAG: hypothetical protein AB7G13_18990 [Lautropia sp.]